MPSYTSATKPLSTVDASAASGLTYQSIVQLQRSGMDGMDVALGTLSALRSFVLWNVGPEGIDDALKHLADILVNGER